MFTIVIWVATSAHYMVWLKVTKTTEPALHVKYISGCHKTEPAVFSKPKPNLLFLCSNHHLSFIPWSTTVTLSFSIFLAVNLIAFNLFSTPQLEPFLIPLATAISHPSSNLYTGSKLISASNTKFSLSPTKHFNLKNLPICTAFSTFNLTLLLVHLLLSLFSVRQSTRVSK